MTEQPSTLAEPVIVAEFFKNRRKDIVRITLAEYEGRPLIDVRQFFIANDGTVQPSKRGVAMSIRRLPDLAKAIEKAVVTARQLGLIEAKS